MIKRAMIALAASAALVPAAAMAQTVADPDPSYGTPDIALAVAAAAAQGASRMGPMHRGPVRTGGPLRAGTPGNHNPGMRHGNGHGGTIGGPACGGTGCGMNHGGGMHQGGQTHRRHFQFNRIHRGGFVGRQFFGGRFVINNWSNFGFSAPPSGARWIRYYDDALLIDGSGRVLDGRYGFDWDRYGDSRAYGDDGAAYMDDRDSGEWDEDMDEGHARGGSRYDDDRVVRVEDRMVSRGRHMGPPPGHYGQPMPMPPPMPGYGGHGYGYGYGYGYGGLVIVTETTVHAAPVVETRTVYETVVERVRVKPRARKRCVCSRPAPRPRPGERG